MKELKKGLEDEIKNNDKLVVRLFNPIIMII